MKQGLFALACCGLGLTLSLSAGLRDADAVAQPAPSVSAIPSTLPATPPSAAPRPTSPSASPADKAPLEQVLDNPLAEQIGLALEGINLFQGDKGAELWRLKASFAHLSQDGSDINVDQPRVRYTLGDPGSTDFLDVVAAKGRIADHQRVITLWDNVVVTRADQRLRAPRLNYDAATRMMVFPEGAQLDAPGYVGQATIFAWSLATNIMHGDKGVEVLIKPRIPASDAVAPDADAASPAPAAVPRQGDAS